MAWTYTLCFFKKYTWSKNQKFRNNQIWTCDFHYKHIFSEKITTTRSSANFLSLEPNGQGFDLNSWIISILYPYEFEFFIIWVCGHSCFFVVVGADGIFFLCWSEFLNNFDTTLGLVLGLVGLNDVKGIDVAQRIWPWGCPTKAQKQPKNAFSVLFGCFWAFVEQPHGHIRWATSMPFASFNPTNPRMNLINLHCTGRLLDMYIVMRKKKKSHLYFFN